MVFSDFHFYSEVLGIQTAAYILLPQPQVAAQSSSPIPVEKRSSCSVCSSAIGCALLCASALVRPFPAADAFGAACSTMEFHAPQAGHLPAHFAVSLPHSVQ